MVAATDLHPRLDPSHLAVVRCPSGWQPPALPGGAFAAVVAAEDETTVVVPESALDDPAWSEVAQQVDHGWRRITFAGPLPWELVGFLADVAGRLAAAQIPFTAMSGFTPGHVLARPAQADRAVALRSGEQPPPQQPGTNP